MTVHNNNFEMDDKYNLFRSVGEIIKPTISKKNISNYRIILEDYLYPIRVYYPKKVSNIKNVIIFIHGDAYITGCIGKYEDILKEMAVETDNLVVALDYDIDKEISYPDFYEKIYQNITYLYKEFEDFGILYDNITLAGDSFGGSICYAMNVISLERGDFKIDKEILFYPNLSINYTNKSKFDSVVNKCDSDLCIDLNKFYKEFCNNKADKYLSPFKNNNYKDFPKSIIFVSKTDLLKDECFKYYEELLKENKDTKYVEFAFTNHGFLKDMDKDIKKEVYNQIKSLY